MPRSSIAEEAACRPTSSARPATGYYLCSQLKAPAAPAGSCTTQRSAGPFFVAVPVAITRQRLRPRATPAAMATWPADSPDLAGAQKLLGCSVVSAIAATKVAAIAAIIAATTVRITTSLIH